MLIPHSASSPMKNRWRFTAGKATKSPRITPKSGADIQRRVLIKLLEHRAGPRVADHQKRKRLGSDCPSTRPEITSGLLPRSGGAVVSLHDQPYSIEADDKNRQ